MNIIIGNKSFLSKSLEIYFLKKKIDYVKLDSNSFVNSKINRYKFSYCKIFYFSGFNRDQKIKFVDSNVNKIKKFIKNLKKQNFKCTIYYPSSIYVNTRDNKSAYVKKYIKAKKIIEELLISSSTKNFKVWIGRLPSIVRKDYKYLVFSRNSFFNSIIKNFKKHNSIYINLFEKRDIVYANKLFDYLVNNNFKITIKNFKIDYVSNNYPFNFMTFYKHLLKINFALKENFDIKPYTLTKIEFYNIKNKKKCGNFPTYQLMCNSLFYQLKN